MLDPFTHHVVCAILLEQGGRAVSLRDGTPVHLDVPRWAHHPLRELPWTERMASNGACFGFSAKAVGGATDWKSSVGRGGPDWSGPGQRSRNLTNGQVGLTLTKTKPIG